MLMRLDLALMTEVAEVAGRLVVGKVVALVEEDREDIKPLVMLYMPATHSNQIESAMLRACQNQVDCLHCPLSRHTSHTTNT